MFAVAETLEASRGLTDEIAIVLVFALIGGFLASRLRLPPIVGYLAAGLIVGPFTPGFVADVHLAEQLGEIGIVILMFGVGLHFSVQDMMAVRSIAIPGALIQSGVTTVLGISAATLFGWSFGAGLVLGLALSVASTVVLVRALVAYDSLDTPDGRIAVGWLIIEDMFSVLVLVLLPIVAISLGGHEVAAHPAKETLSDALLKQGDSALAFGLRSVGLGESPLSIVAVAFTNLTLLVGFVLLLKRFLADWTLERAERISEEIFTLTVVILALFVAVVSKSVFGLSDALGAFLAGVMIGHHRLSHRVASDIRPLRDLFGIVFFASVGMLLKPSTVLAAPLELVTVVFVIMVVKPVITALVLHVLHQRTSAVATIAPGLGQIGEFSFILAALGRTLGLLPDLGYQLIISGSIVSIALNPLLFKITHAVVARGHPEAVTDPAPSAPPPGVAPAQRTEPGEHVLP